MNEIYPLPLTRAEEAGKKPIRLVRAAARIAIIMVREEERVCLFVQHPTKGLELPGGAVEAGEIPSQTSLRELNEEAGILLPANHPLILIQILPIIDHREGNWLDIIYGTVAIPAQTTPQKDAEFSVHWLNAAEIEEQVDTHLSSHQSALQAINMSALWTNAD